MLYDQSLLIGVMDVGDWASSSDSEVHVEETNDDEHCYTSGDLPKLQFRYNFQIVLAPLKVLFIGI